MHLQKTRQLCQEIFALLSTLAIINIDIAILEDLDVDIKDKVNKKVNQKASRKQDVSLESSCFPVETVKTKKYMVFVPCVSVSEGDRRTGISTHLCSRSTRIRWISKKRNHWRHHQSQASHTHQRTRNLEDSGRIHDDNPRSVADWSVMLLLGFDVLVFRIWIMFCMTWSLASSAALEYCSLRAFISYGWLFTIVVAMVEFIGKERSCERFDRRLRSVLGLCIKVKCILVAKNRMKLDDHLLFLLRKPASLDIRPQVISPSQSAAFTTAVEPGLFRERCPTSMAMFLDVRDELLIFLLCPWTFL
ncbi:hypothetical protein V2J09_014798 [Rumex salicifolius]